MPAVNAEVVSKGGKSRESYGWITTIALPNEDHKTLPGPGGRLVVPSRVNVRLSFTPELHAASASASGAARRGRGSLFSGISPGDRPGLSYVTTRVAECKVQWRIVKYIFYLYGEARPLMPSFPSLE